MDLALDHNLTNFSNLAGFGTGKGKIFCAPLAYSGSAHFQWH